MVSDDFLHQERIVLDSAVDKLEDRMFAPDTTPETTSSSSAPAKLGAAGLSSYKEGGARYDAFEKAAAASQLTLDAADLDLPAAQYIANTEAVSAAGAKGSGAVPGAADEAEPVVHLTREQIANLACMCSLRRPHSPQVTPGDSRGLEGHPSGHQKASTWRAAIKAIRGPQIAIKRQAPGAARDRP
jgi:hypothetical protein